MRRRKNNELGLEEQSLLDRDVAVIRRSIEQFKTGKSQEVGAFFAELRAELLALKAAQAKDISQRPN